MNYQPNDNSNGEDLVWVKKTNNSFRFGEPIVGLKLESPENRANMLSAGSSKTCRSSNSVSSNKRSRMSYQGMQTICCQVEGCNLDLASAKDYHRRHRICESHAKSPKVIVAGMERRFCQQCSRFHNLSEFDGKKRSCRRRLSDHNARRRRPQSEPSRTGVFSSIYEGRAESLLFNKIPSSASNLWEGFSRLKMTQSGNPLIRPQVDIDRKKHLPSDDVRNAISLQQLNSGINTSAVNTGTSVFPCTHSLLSSTTSWGLNDPEPATSLEQLMQLESQTWPLISSENAAAEQERSISPMHSMDMQSTNSSEFQQFRPVKTTCESGFYSSRIN